MEIYNKLPNDLQLKIKYGFKKDIIKKKILSNEKYKLIKEIDLFLPDLRDYSSNNTYLEDWFNSKKEYRLENKYMVFFSKILPEIRYEKNTYNICISVKNLYFQYKKNHIGSYKDFINLVLDNLSLDELSDFYAFIKIHHSS